MDQPFDRRGFLKSAAGTLALLLSPRGLSAAQTGTPAQQPPAGPPVRFAVIGLGAWGREILDALGRTDALHEVMLQVAQADLSFRFILEIRNRLTEAYQEIMKMQI